VDKLCNTRRAARKWDEKMEKMEKMRKLRKWDGFIFEKMGREKMGRIYFRKWDGKNGRIFFLIEVGVRQ
jgi:hypothetical protein